MMKYRERRILPVLYRGLLACAACFLMTAGFQSLAAKEGKVKINSANVRSEAGVSSESLGKLPAGTAFTVSEETVDAENNTWYHIEYTLDGEQKTGWMRSDVVEITSEGEPEGSEEPTGEIPADTQIQGITLREPESMPELSGDFTQSQVGIGESTYTAFAVNGELTGNAEFYLVYGEDASGVGDWYFYDAALGTLQRNVGQFTSGGSGNDGLLEALQKENEELQGKQDEGITVRNYIILGVGVLCLILLIVVIILAVKMSRIEFIDDDEYDDEPGEDEYEEEGYEDQYDDDEEDDVSWMEVARAEKRAAEEKNKKRKESRKEKEEEPKEPEEWEEEDGFMEDSLEDLDDGLDEYFNELNEGNLEDQWDDGEDFQEELWEEKPAKRSKRERESKKEKRRRSRKDSQREVSQDDFDDSDDFDIEIVDLDDLDL